MSTLYKGVIFLAVSSFIGESIEFIVNMILAKGTGETWTWALHVNPSIDFFDCSLVEL